MNTLLLLMTASIHAKSPMLQDWHTPPLREEGEGFRKMGHPDFVLLKSNPSKLGNARHTHFAHFVYVG